MKLMFDYWIFDYDVGFPCYTKLEFNKLTRIISIARDAKEKGI